jgi:hypothetical protein
MEKPQATHEEPEESGQANPGALSFVKLLGIEMGVDKERVRILTRMKECGLSVDEIARYTDLPLEEVEYIIAL